MKQKWLCEACNQGGEVDGDGDVISVLHDIMIEHHAVSPDCEAPVLQSIRAEGKLDIRKGDLVKLKNADEEIGIVVAIGPSENCVVLWGNGLHMEGPTCNLVPVPFQHKINITASFIEMVNRCYPEHMAWLREGSPGSGRFA